MYIFFFSFLETIIMKEHTKATHTPTPRKIKFPPIFVKASFDFIIWKLSLKLKLEKFNTFPDHNFSLKIWSISPLSFQWLLHLVASWYLHWSFLCMENLEVSIAYVMIKKKQIFSLFWITIVIKLSLSLSPTLLTLQKSSGAVRKANNELNIYILEVNIYQDCQNMG